MKHQTPNIKNQTQTGFTLVETLVALSIFTTAIVAIIVVSAGGIGNLQIAEKRAQGSFLAQEGIELVRNIRDSAMLAGTNGSGWTTFITSNSGGIAACTNGASCTIDPITLAVTACVGSCPPIRHDLSGGIGTYDYTSTTASVFVRTIQVSFAAPGTTDEVRVTSTVSWPEGTTQSLTLTEDLFNWQ